MPNREPHILIADDQPDIIGALSMLLRREGYEITSANSPAQVEQLIAQYDFDAALVDLNYARDTTSGIEGFELLTKIATLDSTLPIIVMTAWSSVEGAVEAMRRGAKDYLQKPWDNARLLATLKTHLAFGQSLRETRRLNDTNHRLSSSTLPELFSHASEMQKVIELIRRVAPSDASILISGEHGTGKDVVSRWIHELSLRKSAPFIAVNSGALSDGVFESEFFGHVKGAFTDAKSDRMGCFELAEKGTLFLDEIGTMPLSQQAKLLRVLQSKEFQPVGSTKIRRCDVRIVSATNVNVEEEVKQSRFRQDLLYRLNTVEIRLPPLRERAEDIPLLAQTFLHRLGQKYSRPKMEFAPSALKVLLQYTWPGNVRELEHCVERAILLAKSSTVQPDELNVRLAQNASTALEDMTLEEVEGALVKKALAKSKGNVSAAAKALGLSRAAFYRRMDQFGLKVAE